MPDQTIDAQTKRRYVSTRRAEEAAERRATMITAAIAMLRMADRPSDVSLDGVAQWAGVSRLTVYNQLGSRRGLLEAVFDALSHAGGIARLGEVAHHDHVTTGLDAAVSVFTRFWTSDPAVGRVYAEIATDPDVAAALAPRLLQGRLVIARTVTRLTPDLDEDRRGNIVDLIEVLSDYSSIIMLSRSRAPEAVVALLSATCRSLLVL